MTFVREYKNISFGWQYFVYSALHPNGLRPKSGLGLPAYPMTVYFSWILTLPRDPVP